MKINYTDSHTNFNDLLEEIKLNQYDIILDSRNVTANALFVSLPILTKNISDEDKLNQQLEYMKMAAKNQAKYIICEEAIAQKFISIFPIAQLLLVKVDNVRLALGEMSKTRYASDSNTFPLIGITGTNGKTTLAFLLNYFFNAKEKKCALLGTVEYSYPNFKVEAPLTTPDCVFLHSFFEKANNAQCDYAIMEVSSHALEQERVAGLDFNTAIFTNLTQDHLDYHSSMEEYFEAKSKLFARADIQIINADDSYGQRLLKQYPDAIAYTLKNNTINNNILYGELLSSSPEGLKLKLAYKEQEYTLHSLLIGEHNAYNLLALIACGLAHGYSLQDFCCIENFKGVCGRLERVENSKNIHAFVD